MEGNQYRCCPVFEWMWIWCNCYVAATKIERRVEKTQSLRLQYIDKNIKLCTQNYTMIMSDLYRFMLFANYTEKMLRTHKNAIGIMLYPRMVTKTTWNLWFYSAFFSVNYSRTLLVLRSRLHKAPTLATMRII